ncbi:hypothetical protein N7539_005139 [Penicillium diatomitis]|uniref:Uncharacterized protein n=1 Tax=Penicillium diatomitis TaxID=2819901 RepID=A0A9W9X6T8_9EURO|nr:uncharacterized protein N7539_005139 [Penicillium diatomitis]KAJ5485151.1 hypothetical protein N7539_005139 [Penicillium diatomitis]
MFGKTCEYKFVSKYGRFMVEPGQLERVEGSELREMFLPKLTPLGQKALRNSGFVRSQLMHYGVQFEDKELTGQGTLLMKRVLQAGKCDKVPEHILQLKEQMHMQFLETLSPTELARDPTWAMEKYFLTSGEPDRTKTTVVVCLPFHLRSEYGIQCLIDAANKVPGLNHEKAVGPETKMVFMGWDAAAVKKEAREYPAKAARKLAEASEKREQARDKMHHDYLKTLTRKRGGSKATKNRSPVGSYIVDSACFEDHYADGRKFDLTLEIQETDRPGVFQADFDFGVLEGIMMICDDEETLDEYCREADREDDFDDSDSLEDDTTESSESEVETFQQGSKRKASGSGNQVSKKPKQRKARKTPSRKYWLRLKCRELEGQLHFDPEEGSIEFEDDNLVSFEGAADFPCMGQDVGFYARKISDEPSQSSAEWRDYSERQYEYERVRRWH